MELNLDRASTSENCRPVSWSVRRAKYHVNMDFKVGSFWHLHRSRLVFVSCFLIIAADPSARRFEGARLAARGRKFHLAIRSIHNLYCMTVDAARCVHMQG
jgi:hypothetical protein